jgi:DNA-binding Lrp family transcriptional regulator
MTTPGERDLIALLRENGRTPVAELARRLGVSRSTVQSRLERLERSGIIRGYSVRLATEYLDAQLRAHLLLTVSPKLTPRVVEALRRIPEVRTVHSVSGSFDMIAIMEAASVSAMDALIDRIGELEGVERTVSSIILSTRIDR